MLQTVRPEEQQLWLSIQIHDLLLDARTMPRYQQVNDSLATQIKTYTHNSHFKVTHVYILLKSHARIRPETWKDSTLRASLRNVFVLE